MRTLDSQIHEGKITSLHLLCGQEDYLIQSYKHKLKDLLIQPDDSMNFSYFEGEKTNLDEVVSLGVMPPFLAERRVIILENTGWFKKATEGKEKLSSLPDSTCLIFCERDIDKRNKMYKWVNKEGVVTNCEMPNEKDMILWVAGYLGKANKKIKKSSVQYLLERVGISMYLLKQEMDKLIAYTGERSEIKKEDIDAICSGVVEDKIFQMMDAVVEKRQEEAMSMYHDLLSLKTPAMQIFTLLGRHIRILFLIEEAEGESDASLAKKIGVAPFWMKKYRSQQRVFSRETLEGWATLRADLEESIKVGNMKDTIAVEIFLSEILTKS